MRTGLGSKCRFVSLLRIVAGTKAVIAEDLLRLRLQYEFGEGVRAVRRTFKNDHSVFCANRKCLWYFYRRGDRSVAKLKIGSSIYIETNIDKLYLIEHSWVLEASKNSSSLGRASADVTALPRMSSSMGWQLPPAWSRKDGFPLTPISYYAVLLHELTHWTGHKNRCDRDLTSRFGKEAYAARCRCKGKPSRQLSQSPAI